MHPVNKKLSILGLFQEYFVMAVQLTGGVWRSLQTTKGEAYVSREGPSLLNLEGTLKRITCAYTPYQYGVAVRMNYTILGTARALLN